MCGVDRVPSPSEITRVTIERAFCDYERTVPSQMSNTELAALATHKHCSSVVAKMERYWIL